MRFRGAHVRTWLVGVAMVAVLAACEVGSTEVAGGATEPSETAPTGPTVPASTGPTGPTETTSAVEGTWNGTWGVEEFPDAGTFSMEIVTVPDGFEGTIEVRGGQGVISCVSDGTVEIGLEGDRITFGSVEAEQQISFTGVVSADRMSGTWQSPSACPPPNAGIWEATRS